MSHFHYYLKGRHVAAAMLRRPEPTKSRVESTTLRVTAIIEFPRSIRFTLRLFG